MSGHFDFRSQACGDCRHVYDIKGQDGMEGCPRCGGMMFRITAKAYVQMRLDANGRLKKGLPMGDCAKIPADIEWPPV